MKKNIFTLTLLFFFISGFAQNQESMFDYDVRVTYQKEIKEEKLHAANNLKDINNGYASSWINDYISSEISATCNGKIMKISGKNDVFNTEQKNMLAKVDMGSDIVVEVKYKLKEDIRTVNFTVTLIPEVEAEFIGGQEQVKRYLKENAINHIPEAKIKTLEMAAISFYVSEDGKTIDPQVLESSGDDNIDQLLIKVINNMPAWKPAKNSKGVNIRQQFQLLVGNMVGC